MMKKYAKCKICGCVYRKERMLYVKGFGYICRACQSPESYSSKNHNYAGKSKNIHTISFEFETNVTPSNIYELLRYKFIHTVDSSIQGFEWKSPIYRDLRVLNKHAKKLDKYAYIVTDGCGTHIHVYSKAVEEQGYWLEEVWQYIWTPLINYMLGDKEGTVEFWGRDFSEYADWQVEGCSRYEAFSCHTSTGCTVEYRLPKFINSVQFMRVVKFARNCTELIDKRLGKGISKQKARRLGNAILKLYQRYIREV